MARTKGTEVSKQVKVLENIRRGGAVRRHHTLRILDEQTVAAHSWGVASLIASLHPEPPVHLLCAALFHDVAEYEVGDVPYHAKTLANVDKELERRESEIRKSLDTDYFLTDEENVWLKACDMLEMCFFYEEEMNMGNTFVSPIFDNALTALIHMKLPQEIQEILDERWGHEISRLSSYNSGE